MPGSVTLRYRDVTHREWPDSSRLNPLLPHLARFGWVRPHDLRLHPPISEGPAFAASPDQPTALPAWMTKHGLIGTSVCRLEGATSDV